MCKGNNAVCVDINCHRLSHDDVFTYPVLVDPLLEFTEEELKKLSARPGNIIPYNKDQMPILLHKGKSYDQVREDFREEEGI